MTPLLTSDARARLREWRVAARPAKPALVGRSAAGRTGVARQALSRRDFMKRSGALIVAFSTARLAGDLGLAPDSVSAQGINGVGSPHLDSWIAIGADGRVTAYTGKCELGTGLYTAQMQLVAEELCVPMDRVMLIQCDTSMTPDQGTTSGAQSHPTNFNHSNLALACATAREALVQMAAERLGFATLWAPEHVVLVEEYASQYPYSSGRFPGPPDIPIADPFTTLAYAAACTSTIATCAAPTARDSRPRSSTPCSTS